MTQNQPDNEEADEVEREGGLSNADRRFLAGQSGDVVDNTKRQRRRRIRNRVAGMMLDFTLLLDEWDPDEIATVFADAGVPDGDRDLYEGMRDALALVLVSFYDRQEHNDDDDVIPEAGVDSMVAGGLRRALQARGMELHDREPVSYNTRPVDLEELHNRFTNHKPLTYNEFQTLRASSIFGDEVLDKLQVQMMGSPPDENGDDGEEAKGDTGSDSNSENDSP